MFSVFTPTHDPRFLTDAYESLLAQTRQDWEWIIVVNNGANLPPLPDPRIRVLRYDHKNVGALKAAACARARGEWLVELDHDDWLMPTCLEEIGRTDADFCYSNCVQIDQDWKPVVWGSGYGWEWREVEVQGHACLEAVSPEPWPSNLSRIWFAPNHVRAWKRELYERIGGHDPSMHLSDDHDLVARSALAGVVAHIDKPLYVYRVHGANTWLQHQDEIQVTMWENHDRYFIPLAERWAKQRSLALIDLGGAHGCPDGYLSYDRHHAQIVGDLNEDWHLPDQSIGVLRAHDILEHLRDPIHAMNEAWRVLAHGGVLDVLVPSTIGVGAFCDPTHVSFWNRRSFRYYTEGNMRAYLEPECWAKFQVVKLVDTVLWDDVPYVQAQLTAIHDGLRLHGALLWS